MDPDELLSLKLRLDHEFADTGAVPAADILLCAFAAALQSPSACAPFPPAATSNGTRQFAEARRALDAIPALHELLHELQEESVDQAPQLPTLSWRLLQWLILLLAPERGVVRAASVERVVNEINVPQLSQELSKCCCILELAAPPATRSTASFELTDATPPIYCWCVGVAAQAAALPNNSSSWASPPCLGALHVDISLHIGVRDSTHSCGLKQSDACLAWFSFIVPIGRTRAPSHVTHTAIYRYTTTPVGIGTDITYVVLQPRLQPWRSYYIYRPTSTPAGMASSLITTRNCTLT